MTPFKLTLVLALLLALDLGMDWHLDHAQAATGEATATVVSPYHNPADITEIALLKTKVNQMLNSGCK
jgi:hypothetical protein